MAKLKLLSLPGNNGIGQIHVVGVNPGDKLLSVVATNGDGKDYTTSFLDEVFLDTASVPPGIPYIEQTNTANLSALSFVALVAVKDD